MLSIAPIRDSGAAVAYFEKDDYYTKGEGEGAWYGKGAETLGLAGPITREAFANVLEGRLADGINLGRMRDGELEHHPGWDLTFSAPKSVSIAAEVGGDERLFDAHDAAVKAALDWLQENAASTRTRGFFGATKDIQTDNLVIALFQHDTSREQDPQLHTHSVVANATQREDGKWASLDSRDLYTFKMAVGNIYRAELAQQVQKLGYHIERTSSDGRFELQGVSGDLLDEFSTRRQQIEKAMEERGMEGAEQAAKATLMTRASKENYPREDLLGEWLVRAGPERPAIAHLVAAARSAGDVRSAAPFRPEKAVESATDRLSEAEAVFTRAELIRWSLAAAMGRGTIDTIEAATVLETASGALEKTRIGRNDAFTTPKARSQEKRISESVQNGFNTMPRMVPGAALQAALAGSTLDGAQREALELVATSRDRYVAIVGRPGTGKSYLMNETRQLLEAHGKTVIGMAQNSEAARKLEQDSGIKSGTLHKQLRTAYSDLKKLGGGGQEAAATRANYANQVWIVDEATQVGSRSMRRLTAAADKLGFRVVLIGDPQQLAAIDAGKPFELMLKAGMKHVELDDIRRQKNPEHLKAVRAAIKGDMATAMQTLAGDTQEIGDRKERIAAILTTWRALEDKRADTYMLTAGAAEKGMLNDGARAILRGEGKLAGEAPAKQLGRVFARAADKKESFTYQVGDVVRFGAPVKSLDIKSGEYLRVAAINKNTNQVTLAGVDADGKDPVIQWNPRQAGTGNRGAELFRPRDSSAAPGETIRWTRNDPKPPPEASPNDKIRLNNGQLLTVLSIKDGKMEVRTAAGDVKTIDASTAAGQHWEHAYASTVYSSQGGTANHVLVNAESGKGELFSQKAFLVAISRQRETLTLFTDNNESFQQNIERHLGSKTSVIESRGQLIQDRVVAMLERMEAEFRGERVTPAPSAGKAPEKAPEPVPGWGERGQDRTERELGF